VVVCGVYGNECVQETVNGLLERDRRIEVNVLKDCISPITISIEEDNADRVLICNQSELVIV